MFSLRYVLDLPSQQDNFHLYRINDFNLVCYIFSNNESFFRRVLKTAKNDY